MSVRTKQLVVRRAGLPTGNQTLYTCPSGETVIVKELDVYNRSGAVLDFRLGVDPVGATPASVFREYLAWAAKSWVQISCWLVLMAGDSLFVASTGATTAADGLFVIISGTELEGVAD